MLHVSDDLTQVAGQVLAGEGQGFLGAAECQWRRKGFRFGGRDGQTQGDGRTAIPVGQALPVVALGNLTLREGGDTLGVAVAKRLGWAGLERTLQLHHVKGILGGEQETSLNRAETTAICAQDIVVRLMSVGSK